jgi:ABC-type uncharacterized transport system substrate-binding protein
MAEARVERWLAAILAARLVDHCHFYNLPCMHTWAVEVHNGALVSYGPTTVETFSGAANYVDRILKGAKVADLPFEEPTNVKLVINLRTARARDCDPAKRANSRRRGDRIGTPFAAKERLRPTGWYFRASSPE